MKRQVAVVLALFVVLALPAFGEEPMGGPGWVPGPDNFGEVSGSERPEGGRWGGTDYVSFAIPTEGFSPLSDGAWSHFSTGWSYRSGGGNTATCSGVYLPSGASLIAVTTYTDDTDAASNVTVDITRTNLLTSVGTDIFSFTTTGTPGIQRVARFLTAPHTVDNYLATYNVCYFHSATGSTLRNAGLTFWYKLQVSPAPATATFPADVPTTHPFFRYVEAMAASGLTGGCGTNLFCPDTPVTRGQLSVFLAAALGLHFPN